LRRVLLSEKLFLFSYFLGIITFSTRTLMKQFVVIGLSRFGRRLLEDIDAFTGGKLPISSRKITGLFRRFFSRKP